MKRTKLIQIITCLIICTMVFMTSCVTEGPGTLDEPEITVEYLENEYSQQLLRDGAQILFGSIDLVRVGDDVMITIFEKEIVADPSYPRGFYIADKNLESEFILSLGVRATFLLRDEGIKQAMEHDEFIDVVWQDFFETMAEDPEYQEFRLYYIYVLDGYVELLIARELP